MTNTDKLIDSPEVAAVFAAYPQAVQTKLLFLRDMIFSVAAEIEEVGHLKETLKWGQPSYLTKNPKTGTTIRIDQMKSQPGQYAMYFHCQTTLVDTIRELYPDEFEFEGNRSVIFHVEDKIPVQALKHCIYLALTYHSKKLLHTK